MAAIAIVGLVGLRLMGGGSTSNGPWTQADADAVKAAESGIVSTVCYDPLWEKFMAGPNFDTTANDVARRSEYAGGLASVVASLRTSQASPGGRLLDPDLSSLIAGLEVDRQKLDSPMTQAEFDPLFMDLVRANQVMCWRQREVVAGQAVSLYGRVVLIQDWVNENVEK